MRVLISSFTFYPDANGQAVFALNLIQEMLALGHEILVLTQESGSCQPNSLDPRIKIIRFPSINLNRIIKDLRIPFFSQRKINTIISEFQPDLIHIQDPSPLSQAVIHQAHRRNISVVITHHTGPEITAPYINPTNLHVKRFLHWIVWSILRQHLNQANLIIVPSNFSAKMLKQRGVRPDVKVIACGIKLENFKPCLEGNRSIIRQQFGLDLEKILLIYIGRLDFEKNIDSLLQAISLMNNQNIQLAIVGQGAKEDYLRNLSKELGLDSQVFFLGTVNNEKLPQILNSTDIFVMPGNGESFSIATLEAMACSKPVIAANAAALPELVDHQKNGLLFQAKSQKDLAESLQYLVNHKTIRESMGDLGHIKAQNYSLALMSHNYDRAYRSCCTSISNKFIEKTGSKRLSLHQFFLSFNKQRFLLPKKLFTFLVILITLLLSIFVYDQAQARPNLQLSELAEFTITTPEKLLVIAPHPDDELLASGGVMQNVIAKGGEVKVVVVTNGDGELISRFMKDPLSLPKAENYIGFGEYRQKETMQALESIGVDHNNVFFLGYPDGMISKLWESDWSIHSPLKASYTKTDSSPYQNTYNKQAMYRGSDLFEDLLAIITDFQPNIILVPHPEDTHLDHASVSNFSQFTIAQMIASNQQPVPIVYAYIVHYKGYPMLRRENSKNFLLPPAALANNGEGWYTYSLSLSEKEKKEDALKMYKSQLRTSGYYLQSFVRNNEIFYDLPVTQMSPVDFESDDLMENSLLTEINYHEPVRERASRFIFSSTDLISWHTVRINNLICFGSETRGPSSNQINYIIRAKLPDGKNLQIFQSEDIVWLSNRNFNTCFNIDEFNNPDVIGFAAETRYKSDVLDRTAWRFITLNDEQVHDKEIDFQP
ncbi:MAG: hypothetical protein CVU41_13690 [Chloroflexi bacterium HGW-Chloroflexi-3]|nr:MAG: hypothetical protein CVU41_13690 [Chloroflexi bacterium HGW-Chloroflexi-3]